MINEDDDITSKRYQAIADLSISQLLQIVWIMVLQNIYGFVEEFFTQFQWYRKRCGGKWSLKCHEKHIYWSPDGAIDFAEVMASFGEIVDVIKKEDWS